MTVEDWDTVTSSRTPSAAEGVLERQLAAPGRAEQVDPVELQLIPKGRQLVDEDVDAPIDVRRAIRPPAPTWS